MKKIALSLALFTLFAPLTWAEEKAQMSFNETTYDYGTIAEADGDAHCTFTFVNSGEAPLIITRAAASCGCTRPEYPKVPIAAGDSSTIKVTYHAAGRPGAFNKRIYLYTNAQDAPYMLYIKGMVAPKKK